MTWDSPYRACLAGVLLATSCLPLSAQPQDAEGCKDHPLFNRMPNFHISECEHSQFDLKRVPVGPAPAEEAENHTPKSVELEGPVFFIRYELNEDATKPSPLQTMRNFQNAARKAGGSIEAEYPGWCKATVDETISRGNNCILYGTTIKLRGQGNETWAFVQSGDEGASYELWVVEREAMKQDISVNELRQKLDQDGFIALYINFETDSATIQQDSMSQLEQVARMLASATALKVEVAGHTDNVGTPESNQKLSEARAKSVAAALASRGVAGDRLAAAGYGQTKPLADNRTEDGRAKNRRVELVKR